MAELSRFLEFLSVVGWENFDPPYGNGRGGSIVQSRKEDDASFVWVRSTAATVISHGRYLDRTSLPLAFLT